MHSAIKFSQFWTHESREREMLFGRSAKSDVFGEGDKSHLNDFFDACQKRPFSDVETTPQQFAVAMFERVVCNGE